MEGRQSEIYEKRRAGAMGEDAGEKYIIIGESKNPHWVGTAKEAQALLTQRFFVLFECWRRFNVGMGLPYNGSWAENDPDVVDAIMTMEEHYRAYYSKRDIVTRLDALLRTR